jgi:tetratricopeptide (TPR) repeat protein
VRPAGKYCLQKSFTGTILIISTMAIPHPYFNLMESGLREARAGDNVKACEYYLKAVDCYADKAEGYYQAASDLGIEGDKEGCITMYELGLKLAKDKTAFYWSYSFYLVKFDQFDKALEMAKLALAANIPRVSGPVHLNVGHVYLLRGDESAAIEEYKASAKDFGEWRKFIKDFKYDYEQVLEHKGISKETFERLQKAVQKND